MDGIFTLPYSEFEAILQMQKLFKKNNGYAVFIPVSRQQKGIDFIVMNTKNNKVLRVQVKSSRSYLGQPKSKRAKNKGLKYYFWFNNFIKKYEKGRADLYLLFGLYPIYEAKYNIKSKERIWKSMILAFTDKEMHEFLKMVKTKREKKEDRFFGIGFSELSAIYTRRGFDRQEIISSHLLANKIKELSRKLR